MQKLTLILFIASLAPLAVLANEPKVYKWVDEDGRVHYGDRPQGRPAEELSLPQGSDGQAPGPPASRAERQRRLLEVMETERLERDEARRKREAAAADRNARCHYARDRVRRYQSAGRLYDLDEQGERRILGDAEYDRAMQRARAEVKKWCG